MIFFRSKFKVLKYFVSKPLTKFRMQQKLIFYHIWFPKYNVRQEPLFFQSKKKKFRKFFINISNIEFRVNLCNKNERERGKTLKVRACRRKIIINNKKFRKFFYIKFFF
jgi:hypothetical protein